MIIVMINIGIIVEWIQILTNMKKLILIGLLIFSINLNAKEEGRKSFESLIVSYNHGIIKASQKNKFEHLKKYLTKEIFLRTMVWIESFQDNNLFMDSKVLKIEFDEYNQKTYTATLKTNEIWKYRYINIKTKKIVKKPTKVTYKLKYYFVLLKDGSWKINHIKILDEKNKKLEE